MDPFSLIAGIASLVYAGFKTYKTIKSEDRQTQIAEDTLTLNKDISQQNFDLSKEQFEYQKELNNTLMEREDTAWQRTIADLQAAGLSPLAATSGASAAPLTSAPAPQKDISGINTALGNMLGAYNDIFNRRLNRQQFALQSAVNTSEMYTRLAESKLNRDYIKLQTDYLEDKRNWENIHGFRDLNWKSELVGFLENITNKNPSSTIPSIGNIVTAGLNGLPTFELPGSVKDFLIKNSTSSSTPSLPSPKILKKDSKVLDKELSKDNNAACNLIETRASRKDKQLLNAIEYAWKFSNAPQLFDSFDEFKEKIYSDDKYRRNIRKELKFHSHSPLELGE